MYVVEVLPLHQERKFLHYCWAAHRRTFTKNLLFSTALLYLDTGGQCSHSSHIPSMTSHSCTTHQLLVTVCWAASGLLVLCGLVLCSIVCVCAPDFSASSDRHRSNSWTTWHCSGVIPWSFWVFPCLGTCSHCHLDVKTHMQSWILNVVQPYVLMQLVQRLCISSYLISVCIFCDEQYSF